MAVLCTRSTKRQKGLGRGVFQRLRSVLMMHGGVRLRLQDEVGVVFQPAAGKERKDGYKDLLTCFRTRCSNGMTEGFHDRAGGLGLPSNAKDMPLGDLRTIGFDSQTLVLSL